jgi:AraC-like DNA-binding protein
MRPLAAASPARGVLTSADGRQRRQHQRVLPSSDLAPYIAHFWWVEWDLALSQPRVAETLPHPTAHLIFELPSRATLRATLHGVSTRRFTRTLRGHGRAFGVKLRPAALRAFLRNPAPATRFTDRRTPIADVFGRDGTVLARTIAALGTSISEMPQAIAAAEAFLIPRATPLPPDVAAIRDLVERIEHDRDIRRAADAARILNIDERTLQRRFKSHVGVAPKWVIQRYRLMEAVEQLRTTPASPTSLADLAATLGYADQSHFTRDFTAIIGISPRAYANSRSPRRSR